VDTYIDSNYNYNEHVNRARIVGNCKIELRSRAAEIQEYQLLIAKLSD